MDFRCLGPELGRFDGIAAIASLIHIRPDEMEQVFSSFKRVLTEIGYIMIILIEGQGLSMERSVVEHNGKKYNRYFYLHNKKVLIETAEKTGITYCCEFELPDEHKSHGWKCLVFLSKPARN